jgi:hypothetical protein
MFRIKANVRRHVSICFYESEFLPGPIQHSDPSSISMRRDGVCDSDREHAVAINGRAHNVRTGGIRQYRLEGQSPIRPPDLKAAGFIGEQEVAFVERGKRLLRPVVSSKRDGPGGLIRRGGGPP